MEKKRINYDRSAGRGRDERPFRLREGEEKGRGKRGEGREEGVWGEERGSGREGRGSGNPFVYPTMM